MSNSLPMIYLLSTAPPQRSRSKGLGIWNLRNAGGPVNGVTDSQRGTITEGVHLSNWFRTARLPWWRVWLVNWRDVLVTTAISVARLRVDDERAGSVRAEQAKTV